MQTRTNSFVRNNLGWIERVPLEIETAIRTRLTADQRAELMV
jgi:hypothetical protein